ncbi:MAG: SMC-Scp complex subunit ScpB [Clostridia bacterium]|nr:SMC-Scp complex subunit ScpB [Clostridia bacterium]
MEKLTNIIESLLYVSGKEVSIDDIAEKLEISKNEVKLAVLELQQKYCGDCGLHLLFFNDKLQFGSNPDYGEAVSSVLNPIRERELSRSMLETIAIIAYKQPVTRMDLEELRGNSEYAIQNLLRLELIQVVGRKDAVGHPMLFGTTDKFLKRFRISSLEDLPDYDELLEHVKLLNTGYDDNYLYRKDVYVDDGAEDVMPPQRQFVPKSVSEEIAAAEDPGISDLSEEPVPDFLKDEEVELIEADDENGYEEDDADEDDDTDFSEYSIDDDDTEYEDEEEDTSDYEDEEETEDDYEEDDK